MASIKVIDLSITDMTDLKKSEISGIVGGRRGWIRGDSQGWNRIRGFSSFSAIKSFNTQEVNNISIVIQIGDYNVANVFQDGTNIIY